ncbi:GNAT family N-acetyltransferase [Epibacterium sp. MM17-32]|uniref:GNAT family N-acetyltransferase n=1 Tax=Epibacterium sp. MM17-32 TaxID=2917734 RepID=UPI001EF53CD3|nr:GNAT family N-acetyltransferase [Epibacterium sp. MM17-32]MCG7627011.1 GNAT family N-acetyltransferase [Epibacterium sp. MM17-32]
MPPHQTPPEIETRRLLLRGWKPDDLTPFAAICANPDVMRYIGTGATLTTEDTARRIASFEAHWAERGYGLFAVQSKATDDLIGFAGLSWPGFLPEILPAVEIGWRFAKAHWGHGYASEAATAALEFGVGTRGLTEIVSIYQPQNAASGRIMQKLGLVFDRRTLDPSCGRAVEVYRLPRP